MNHPSPFIPWFSQEVLQTPSNQVEGNMSDTSTESILQAMELALETTFKNKSTIKPSLYASANCHTSIPHIASKLNIPFFRVACDPLTSSMNMKVLKSLIEQDTNVIVILSMGSNTIKQTYDNIEDFYLEVYSKLKDTTKFHVHIDATFGGLVYPFVKRKWISYPYDTYNVSIHRFYDSRCDKTSLMLVNKMKETFDQTGTPSDFNVKLFNLPDKSTIKKTVKDRIDLRDYLVSMLNLDYTIYCPSMSLCVHIHDIPNEYKEKLNEFNKPLDDVKDFLTYKQQQYTFDCCYFIKELTTKSDIDAFLFAIGQFDEEDQMDPSVQSNPHIPHLLRVPSDLSNPSNLPV